MASDVIIIGAGACGLMAACELLKAGKTVEVIDARPYVGGRMHTLHTNTFTTPIETGAEFIHGEQPLTKELLKKYEIRFYKTRGELWQVQHNFKKENDQIEDDHHRLEKALKKLKEDVSVQDFLNRHFNKENDAALVKSVTGFVEGYDTAHISKASTWALKKEWLQEDGDQYRINGGYTELAEALADECTGSGAHIHLSSVVVKIRWSKNEVEVETEAHKKYRAPAVVITQPIGLLAETKKQKGTIAFIPEIPLKREAAKQLGYGGVIKFILQFKDAFWKSKAIEQVAGRSLDKLGFLFSNAVIPTWWTQFPKDTPLLTGWLGGPASWQLLSDEQTLLNKAIDSLASIFHINAVKLKQQLTAYKIANWCDDSFSRGSYSYEVVNGNTFKEIIITPEQDTLYFAGEALSTHVPAGTVEAALASGKEVAGMIVNKK